MMKMNSVIVVLNENEYIEIAVKLSILVLGRNINSKVATKSAECEK